MRISTRKRKAISPVLATVILIAITLIAAIAVAGFVFGLFGSFTSSAQVSARVTTCIGTTNVCTVVMTNTGTSSVSETGCTEHLSGTTTTGAVGFVAPTTTASIPASGTATFTCTPGTAVAQTAGSQAVGSFSLSNGATVSFTGTWQ